MANYTPKDLIKLYYKQLTIGCDCGECENNVCKSSGSFQLKLATPDDAAVEAIHLALRHPANPRLCENIKFFDQEDIVKRKIENFNSYIGKMIRQEKFDEKEAISSIQAIMQEPAAFPYILMLRDGDDDQHYLNPRSTDLLLNETVVCDIPIALRNYKNKLKLMDLGISFKRLVDNILLNDPPNTAHHIRALILIFCMDIYFEDSDDFNIYFLPILSHILELPQWSSSYLISVLSLYPTLLSNLLKPCLRSISIAITKTNKKIDPFSPQILTAAKFISIIYDASQNSKHPIKIDNFYSTDLESILNFKIELMSLENEKNESYLYYPCILPFRFKFRALCLYLNDKLSEKKEFFRIKVNRQNLAIEVDNILRRTSVDILTCPLKITFVGESGIDLSGLTREFFYLAVSYLFSPDYCLFKIVNDKFYWFSEMCLEEVSVYGTLGTLVGLAIYNRVTLPIRFPLLMFKKILNKPLSLVDINELDPQCANSLIKLIDYKDGGGDVSDLALTFSIMIDSFGNKISKPFFVGGDAVEVTNETLDRYIVYYTEYYLNTSVSGQFGAFMEGFRRLCHDDIFYCFTAEELERLVCGEPSFDWETFKKNVYYRGYSAQSKEIKDFWICFDELSDDEKCKFLLFVTGNSRAPVGGFAELHVVITNSEQIDVPPQSHTCFNTINLPHYSSLDKMREGLNIAITNCVGFGLA